MTKLRQPHVPTDAEHMQDYLINWNAGPLGVVLQPDLGADMPPVVAQLLPQPSVLKMAGVREGDLLISVNGKKTTRLGYEKVVRLLFKERLPMVLHFRSPVSDAPRGVLLNSNDPVRGHGRSRTSSAIQTKSLSRSRGRSDVEQHKRKLNAHFSTNDGEVVIKSEKKIQHKSKHKSYEGAKAEAEERRLRKQFSVVWERGSLGISFRAYNSKVNVPCVDFLSAKRGQGRGMEQVCVNDVLIAINGEKTKALGVEKVLRWLHVIEKPVVLRFHASSNRIKHQASTLLPQVAEEDAKVSVRPRRATIPLPQPEYEPPPRPPRRNNSVDQSVPQQKIERERLEDNEKELHPAVVSCSSSQESATFFEKQPIEVSELQYQFGASTNPVNETHFSKTAMNAHIKDQDNGVAGDFRREHIDVDTSQIDVRADVNIVPHCRHPHQVAIQSSQPQKPLSPLARPRATSALQNIFRRQQQSKKKTVPSPVTSDVAPARSRVASRDSQTSNTSQLSFGEAANVVARATGKPVEKCEFGGMPLLDIKEGSVQAKLMYIYAKACLVNVGNSDCSLTSQDLPQPRTSGNLLSRNTHSKNLSYSILQNDSEKSNFSLDNSGDACDKGEVKHKDRQGDVTNGVDSDLEPKQSGVFCDNLSESLAKMQKDISIQPPTHLITTSFSSAGSTFSVSSDVILGSAPALPVNPAEDFISLKDFILQENGRLTERRTVSSLGSTAHACVDGDIGTKTIDSQDNLVYAIKVEGAVADVSKKTVIVEQHTVELDDDLGGERVQSENKLKQAQERADAFDEIIKLDGVHDDADAAAHADDGVSFYERELAASVASLDDLLDLPLKVSDHADENHKDFANDEVKEEDAEKKKEKVDAETNLSSKSLLKVDQTQEEENGESEGYDNGKGAAGELKGHGSYGKEEEGVKPGEFNEPNGEIDHKDRALSNVLVNELYRDVQDVREVIKNKSALLVLVKKSMIDEIQEILQSLQMEMQFERHSTVAVGSTANPLQDSQQSRSTEGETCFRCGAAGELAELDVAGGCRELYCEECWELFFFSEENQSPVTRTSKILALSEVRQLTADEDALDEALKYSFHDSSITREDIIHPWRSLQGSDSISSSTRDSNASSITDEVWL